MFYADTQVSFCHFGESIESGLEVCFLSFQSKFEVGSQRIGVECDKFKGKGFDAFLMSQMWDCQESRDRILEECRYSMLATDFLARGLSSLERANLEMDYLEALAELFPSCEAFFFSGSGKLCGTSIRRPLGGAGALAPEGVCRD